MDVEWYFYALGLAGFVAFLRQVLIRRMGWSEQRASVTTLLLPPVLLFLLIVLNLATDGLSLDAYGLGLLAIPMMLIAVFCVSAVGVGLSKLIDRWPRFEE